MASCECGMFKESGTCYHTGYIPKFLDGIKRPEPEPYCVISMKGRIRHPFELEYMSKNPDRRDPTQV